MGGWGWGERFPGDAMQIQINAADKQTRNADTEMIEREVHKALDRFAERITRVEVHVKDANANKGGVDKQCTIEARVNGLDPMAVSAEAERLETAVSDAAGKLHRVLESELGKRSEKR